MNKKLRDVQIEFEHIIAKAEKLKANKKYTADEREAIIKALKKEFTGVLLDLEYIIDTPGYRDPAYEVQESFVLKARDLNIIKDDKELDEIFIEIHKRKKAASADETKAIKKSIDKAISEKPPDINKLAYILHDIILVEEPGSDTELYAIKKLKELGLFDEVYKLFNEIITRVGEKREREEALEIKNHEARLRTLEREQEKEVKRELATVGKRARSTRKTLLAEAKEARDAAPVHFESPGICAYCHKIIKDIFYHYEPRTKELMHTSCYELYKAEREREEVRL